MGSGLGDTHIIGNGELVSAGRGAGVQTWAQQGDMVRLAEGCSRRTPVPSPHRQGRAGAWPEGQGQRSWRSRAL